MGRQTLLFGLMLALIVPRGAHRRGATACWDLSSCESTRLLVVLPPLVEFCLTCLLGSFGEA